MALPCQKSWQSCSRLIAGILVSNGHFKGVAPDVVLGMAAALGDDGKEK